MSGIFRANFFKLKHAEVKKIQKFATKPTADSKTTQKKMLKK